MHAGRRWTATIAVMAGLMLTGCGAQMTDDEIFQQAWELDDAFRGAVAEVQLQILDDEWRIGWEYGDVPRTCRDGDKNQYEFEYIRMAPDGWRIGTDPKTAATELATWLQENGWADVRVRTYTGDVRDVLVEARRPDAFVDQLSVDYSPGELFDGVRLIATSTCGSGQAYPLWVSTQPLGDPDSSVEREALPTSEHPSAPQSFGWNDDGTRRFR